MPQLEITLPVSPSTNHLYRDGGNGRRVLTAAGKAYKAAVSMLTESTAHLADFTVPPGTTLQLDIAVWFGNRRRRDLSNLIKLPEDAIAQALAFDDCRVADIHIWRAGYDTRDPRMVVRLTYEEV